MTELRQGIGLRAYGQNDPVVEYKREGYAMFEEMIAAIQEETVRRVFIARCRPTPTVERKRVAKVTGNSGGDGTKQQPVVQRARRSAATTPAPAAAD